GNGPRALGFDQMAVGGAPRLFRAGGAPAEAGVPLPLDSAPAGVGLRRHPFPLRPWRFGTGFGSPSSDPAPARRAMSGSHTWGNRFFTSMGRRFSSINAWYVTPAAHSTAPSEGGR